MTVLTTLAPKSLRPVSSGTEQVPHAGGIDERVSIRHHIQSPPVDILEDQRIYCQWIERIAKQGKETIHQDENTR